jgi:hypothetical protein
MQLEQDVRIEDWITSRNEAILALRASRITAVDIASIRIDEGCAQSWQVLEIGDQTRLDRFIPLGDRLRELIIAYSAGRPDSNATHLFGDRQGVAMTTEQIAEIGPGTKLPKRWRPVSRAVANTPARLSIASPQHLSLLMPNVLLLKRGLDSDTEERL